MSHYTEAYVEQKLAAMERVRELHSERNGSCRHCGFYFDGAVKWIAEYPCPTLQALDGEL